MAEADRHHRSLEKWKAQQAAATRARRAAVKQLIAENREEYDRYFAMFAALEDPPVVPLRRRTEAQKIEDEIARLQARLDRG